MKNIFFYFSIALFIMSCSSNSTNNPNEISMFNNISFVTNPTEEVKDLTTPIKDAYMATFDNSAATIPLYRSIKHADYQLYIGLPFNTSFEQLQTIHTDQNLLVNQTDGSSYSYQQYQSDSLYIATLVRKEEGGTIYIAAVTDKEQIKNDSLTYEQLNNRILIKE